MFGLPLAVRKLERGDWLEQVKQTKCMDLCYRPVRELYLAGSINHNCIYAQAILGKKTEREYIHREPPLLQELGLWYGEFARISLCNDLQFAVPTWS